MHPWFARASVAIIDVFQLSYFVESKPYNPNNVLSLYITLVFYSIIFLLLYLYFHRYFSSLYNE